MFSIVNGSFSWDMFQNQLKTIAKVTKFKPISTRFHTPPSVLHNSRHEWSFINVYVIFPSYILMATTHNYRLITSLWDIVSLISSFSIEFSIYSLLIIIKIIKNVRLTIIAITYVVYLILNGYNIYNVYMNYNICINATIIYFEVTLTFPYI